ALRGVRNLRSVEPITDFGLAAEFLVALAGIHGRWWGSPDLLDDGEHGWMRSLESGPAYARMLTQPDDWEDKMVRPRAAATPRVLKDPERLLAARDAMMANRLGFPLTLNHGDAQLANIYETADHHPGFLDWTLRRLPWAMDVAYFVIGCPDVVDRRRW